MEEDGVSDFRYLRVCCKAPVARNYSLQLIRRDGINATPAGAEIPVYEKFMGNTPSSLRLTAGDHKIKLERSGFKTWERTLTVSSGATATVAPTLEKQE